VASTGGDGGDSYLGPLHHKKATGERKASLTRLVSLSAFVDVLEVHKLSLDRTRSFCAAKMDLSAPNNSS